MNHPAGLETPPPDALLRSAALVETIRHEARQAGGWLPFSRYMELALYAPGLGYYASNARQFGSGGDFTTAPEISPLFARALARQVAQILAHGAPVITEFGPGSGALAAQLLGALEEAGQLPERYGLVELSASLRSLQRQTLAARVPHLLARCSWFDTLPERLCGVVLGNEVLDALPADLIVRHATGWVERGVAPDATGTLRWQERPPGSDLAAAIATSLPSQRAWPSGYTSEISRHTQGFVATVADHLDTGVALFIDYGFPAEEYYHVERAAGTLMAHYRHRAHSAPLLWPGLQDVTTHVDFSAVARCARGAGCELLGYTSQARFLLNCGILELMAGSPDDVERWLPESNALHRLLSEAEMGELFKVIAFGRNVESDLVGFAAGDRSARL